MTFAEYAQLPDELCRRYELRQGALAEAPPPIFKHRVIQDRIADVAYVTRKRWNGIDDDNLRGAPEMVIEVLSPSNRRAEMRERAVLCLANGCLEFWVLDEGKRQVTVSTPDGVTVTYHSGQAIPLRLFGDASPSLGVDETFES